MNRSIKITIDNSNAMAEASKLEKKITQLRGELQKLNEQGKKDTHTHKATEKALKQFEKAYGNYQYKIKETQRILENLSGSTYKELESTRKVLRAQLREETRGTEQYNAKLKALNAVQKEFNIAKKEMNSNVGQGATLMNRAANSFNKYFGMATAGIATITGISFTLRKLSQDAAAMDDTYADVMKTTNMTKTQVLDLNEAFKKMDTRTSREQLNMLARDAGKLGLTSKEDILGFVEAANEIQVALGEDLGEGAVREVGKMVDVFTKSTHELEQLDLKGKMLAVGSAINELGASSSAQEDYLVQFAGRLGGVAAQANIGIDAILGFGSVLDQDMQKVEMSATALQQILIKMMGEPAKFAQIAGVEVGKFTDLVRTDANEAVKVLLRSLNEKGGFQELIPLFDEMGLSGTRAVGVLSSLASSVDKIEEAQAIANKSMVEATSLTNEYNIKNTTAQAQLEKLRKAFKDTSEELGMRLNPALLKSTNGFTYIIKAMPALLDFLQKYGRFIIYLVTAYAAYNVGLKLTTLWETKLKTALSLSNIQFRIQYALMVAGRVAMAAFNIVVGLLSGNLTKVRSAWKALNVAMSTNPIGLLMVAVTGAIVAIVKLVKWLNRTSDATKSLKEATKQFNSELATEKREAGALFDALQKANPESDTFLQIRKEIISKYGKYLQGLVDEEGNITDINKAILAVNNGLREQIALKIKNQATDEITAKSLNKQFDLTDRAMKRIGKQVDSESALSSIRETINRTVSEFSAQGGSDYNELQRKLLSDIQQTYGVDAYKGVFNVKNVIEDLVNEVKNSDDALKEVDTRFAGIIDKMTDVSSVIQEIEEDEDPDGTPPGTPSASAYEKALAKLEEYIAREKALIQQKYITGKISQEQYNRELEYLEMERLRKNLELAGLTFEQQQEIELKLFETKKQMLQKIQDEEREHQKKLLEIQQAADKARAESNWNALKKMAKDNEDAWIKEKQEQLKKVQEYGDMAIDLSDQLGNILGQYIAGNEEQQKDAQKNMIMLALDTLEMIVKLAVAEATAKAFASGDPISGAIKTALITSAITLAFSAAKSFVRTKLSNMGNDSSTSADTVSTGSRVVNQRAKGKYDVIGADDGRTYRGVPYTGLASTGFVSTPTLMGEQGRELIVSAPDLSRLQAHINYPLVISAINDARAGIVPQRAKGNYTQTSQTSQPVASLDPRLIAQLASAIERLNNNGVLASVSLSDLQSKQDLINKSKNIGRK